MKILASAYISSTGAFLNDALIHVPADENWLKSIYQSMELEYPKFYKMDTLSKLAFLGTEMLVPAISSMNLGEDNMKLIFANSGSSQQTDLKFIESYQTLGSPSPSLFVYTLPNILTGEIAIRNKWFGENSFFILEEFDAHFFQDQCDFAFNSGNKVCLCGWVEAKDTNKEECFLFLVSPNETETIEEEIKNRFNNYRNE